MTVVIMKLGYQSQTCQTCQTVSPWQKKRLNSLRRRFERDSNFFEQYKAVILSVIVILAVKALLQELCAMKCDWDGPIPQPLSFERQRWTDVSRNLAPGDVVLVVDRDMPRGQWLMGRVERVFPSGDNLVRRVAVRTASSLLVRPIHKLVVILPSTDL